MAGTRLSRCLHSLGRHGTLWGPHFKHLTVQRVPRWVPRAPTAALVGWSIQGEPLSWPSSLQEHSQPQRQEGCGSEPGPWTRSPDLSFSPSAQGGWYGDAPRASVGRREFINGPERFWPAPKHPSQKQGCLSPSSRSSLGIGAPPKEQRPSYSANQGDLWVTPVLRCPIHHWDIPHGSGKRSPELYQPFPFTFMLLPN